MQGGVLQTPMRCRLLRLNPVARRLHSARTFPWPRRRNRLAPWPSLRMPKGGSIRTWRRRYRSYGRARGHARVVPLQQGLVFAHSYAPAPARGRASPERGAGAACGGRGLIAPEGVAILVDERVLIAERLPLRAEVGVGLGAGDEVGFVVGRTTLAVLGARHQDLVAGRVASGKVGPRVVSGVGEGHSRSALPQVVRRGLDHRNELRVVVGAGREPHRRDEQPPATLIRRLQRRRDGLGVVARDEPPAP